MESLVQAGSTAHRSIRSISHFELTRARVTLAEILKSRRDEISSLWLESAGEDAGVRFPDLERYLRSLISGLEDVFRSDDWSLTQTIIDGLAERRAHTGVRLEHGMQRALLAGRHALRAFYDEDNDRAICDEVFLDALHECVFRFSESYQGLRLATESERVHTRIIKSLVMALEARDPYTKGHSISVALLCQRIAEILGDDIDPGRAHLAGLLHDVGKVGIPDSILLKPETLSVAEWRVMHSHPITGASILKPIRLYPDVIAGIRAHHENYDGSGYPAGLSGEEIPSIGRVIRIADSFDAMTSTRAYRSSLSIESAIEDLIGGAGSVYDPEAIEAFIGVIDAPGVIRELSLASLQIDMGEYGPTRA